MMVVCMVVPAFMLYLAVLYIVLFWKFLRVKTRLPFMGLKDGLKDGLSGLPRKKMALCSALVFVCCFAGETAAQIWAPDMLLVFNYEEAARGQNPNVTRFNESGILSEDILEKVIQRGDLKISKEQLADCLALSTPLDKEGLDVTQESDLKISTEYWISCSEKVALYDTKPRVVLELLANVYWEDFVRSYAENDSVLDLSFEETDGMEYLDIKAYLQMQANKLRNYLPRYSIESSSFHVEGGEETFASLSKKIDNYIDIQLERYEAFVLENGLAGNRNTYRSRMQYANRLLDTEQRKDMAAYDVRIETINMYNAFMTRFVLIPTYDEDKEFYMSKTKVGVDYFAEEAKEYLASATEAVEEMEHNSYASAQIGASAAVSDVYARADEQVEELKAELVSLSSKCRELCNAYISEKRDGYIQMSFTSFSAVKNGVMAVFWAILFAVAQGGTALLYPFYKECGIPFGRRTVRGTADSGIEGAAVETVGGEAVDMGRKEADSLETWP